MARTTRDTIQVFPVQLKTMLGQDPAAIRQEIEETRSEMGETMEAIGYKTDVRARTEDFVSEKKKDKVTERVASAEETTPPLRLPPPAISPGRS